MLLIIHKDEKNANAVREMFRFMNLLSYTCKPQDAKRELSPRYRAVLILNPESFPDILSFVTSLRDTAAEEILDYAFHPLKTPGRSSVRTHLCAINRKFRALTGRPLSERAEPFGYRIVTPKTKNYTPCL